MRGTLQSAPFGLFGSQPWFGIVLRGLFCSTGTWVVELGCPTIPRDQLSRLEHQSGGYLRVLYFS